MFTLGNMCISCYAAYATYAVCQKDVSVNIQQIYQYINIQQIYQLGRSHEENGINIRQYVHVRTTFFSKVKESRGVVANMEDCNIVIIYEIYKEQTKKSTDRWLFLWHFTSRRFKPVF